MELDEWFGPYRVRSFPWIDGKRIYFNVQYYTSGQSISKPPAWDKTVYIVNNEAGQKLINDFTHSLVEYIAQMKVLNNAEVTITVQ